MTRQVLCRLAIAALMLAATTTHADASLIGHWTLDDGSGNVVADSSGNSRNGNRNSGTWITSAPPAKVGGALQFNDSGGGVSVNMGSGVLPDGNAERTITAWVNSDQFQDGKFLGYGSTGGGVTFDWTVEGSGVWLRHGGGQVKWDLGHSLSTMRHVAIVVPTGATNVGDVKLYVDGSEETISTINTNSTLNTGVATSFYIGRGMSPATFDGIVDDVQFYDTALSDSDIAWLHDNPGAVMGGGGGGGHVPAVILDTDFTGRTVSGATASNITWATDGVADPGALTATDAGGSVPIALFDTGAAQGHFAPDRNLHTEGSWLVSIPLVLTAPEVAITDLVIDYQQFTNTGENQSPNRDTDWVVSILGSSSGLLGEVSLLNQGATSGLLNAVFGTPVVLTAGQSYSIEILVSGQGPGTNAGIDALTVNGTVLVGGVIPEPATMCALGLAVAGLGGYIRRRRRR